MAQTSQELQILAEPEILEYKVLKGTQWQLYKIPWFCGQQELQLAASHQEQNCYHLLTERRFFKLNENELWETDLSIP